MQTIRVTLSANAGVAVQIGNRRIWVDALHDRKQTGFSALSTDLQKKMLECEAFFYPDYICATHCHPDHYSPELTKKAQKLWPKAKLFLPEQEFSQQVLVAGENYRFTDGDLTLEFIRLPHEGPQYADVKHYGLLIRQGECGILLAGDCATASPTLEQALHDKRIDLAILNFPWITLAKGREFVTKVLRPKHILVCHLPFAQDDISGYRISAQKNARLLSEERDVRLLLNPLQTEILEI